MNMRELQKAAKDLERANKQTKKQIGALAKKLGLTFETTEMVYMRAEQLVKHLNLGDERKTAITESVSAIALQLPGAHNRIDTVLVSLVSGISLAQRACELKSETANED
jgi:succinyl-CoA synthetase beta subunit